MATKTAEGATAGTEAQGDETAVEAATTEEETAQADAVEKQADGEQADGEQEHEAEKAPSAPSGVGLGAGAVVSAALGLVSLSGGWIGTVAGAREQLIGQLRTPSTANVATQIKAVYGNAWHSTALWAGLFALAALLTGVVVLARPAFGAPGRPQAPWIKSVAWAGVSLGVIGLLLAVLKYSDALLALPSTG
jgi:VIT1/CCC1 family predicted Fe2+/Mn2+ transporter